MRLDVHLESGLDTNRKIEMMENDTSKWKVTFWGLNSSLVMTDQESYSPVYEWIVIVLLT